MNFFTTLDHSSPNCRLATGGALTTAFGCPRVDIVTPSGVEAPFDRGRSVNSDVRRHGECVAARTGFGIHRRPQTLPDTPTAVEPARETIWIAERGTGKAVSIPMLK